MIKIDSGLCHLENFVTITEEYMNFTQDCVDFTQSG
jgi:hypothetical protein